MSSHTTSATGQLTQSLQNLIGLGQRQQQIQLQRQQLQAESQKAEQRNQLIQQEQNRLTQEQFSTFLGEVQNQFAIDPDMAIEAFNNSVAPEALESGKARFVGRSGSLGFVEFPDTEQTVFFDFDNPDLGFRPIRRQGIQPAGARFPKRGVAGEVALSDDERASINRVSTVTNIIRKLNQLKNVNIEAIPEDIRSTIAILKPELFARGDVNVTEAVATFETERSILIEALRPELQQRFGALLGNIGTDTKGGVKTAIEGATTGVTEFVGPPPPDEVTPPAEVQPPAPAVKQRPQDLTENEVRSRISRALNQGSTPQEVKDFLTKAGLQSFVGIVDQISGAR